MLWKLAIVRHLQKTQLFFGGGNMNSGETTKFRKVLLSDKELKRCSSENLINEKFFPLFYGREKTGWELD